METILCNLCGAHSDREIFRDRGGRFRAVICERCTLIYLNPRLSATQYSDYYINEYQKNRHSITTYEAAVDRLIKKNSYEKKKQLLPLLEKYIDNNSSVLEYGSGWGTLLRLIKDTFGCRVLGIEISALAVEVSRKFYGVPTESESLEQYIGKNLGQKSDCVIMYHVLEHMLDPLATLTQIKGILSPNGKLFVAVPNMAAPDEDISKFFRVEHCYYFSPETLGKILNKAGFEIVEMKTTARDLQVVVSLLAKEKSVMDEKKYSVDYFFRVVRMKTTLEKMKNFLRPIKKIIWNR